MEIDAALLVLEVYLVIGPLSLAGLANVACREGMQEERFRARIAYLGAFQGIVISPIYVFAAFLQTGIAEQWGNIVALSTLSVSLWVGLICLMLRYRNIEYFGLAGWKRACVAATPLLLVLVKHIVLCQPG